MASIGAIQRNEKIKRITKKFYKKRMEFKKITKDVNKTPGERLEARRKLIELGPFAIPVRIRNRCSVTGNPRSYSRRYGLSRDTLREMVSYNRIPCVTKASW